MKILFFIGLYSTLYDGAVATSVSGFHLSQNSSNNNPVPQGSSSPIDQAILNSNSLALKFKNIKMTPKTVKYMMAVFVVFTIAYTLTRCLRVLRPKTNIRRLSNSKDDRQCAGTSEDKNTEEQGAAAATTTKLGQTKSKKKDKIKHRQQARRQQQGQDDQDQDDQDEGQKEKAIRQKLLEKDIEERLRRAGLTEEEQKLAKEGEAKIQKGEKPSKREDKAINKKKQALKLFDGQTLLDGFNVDVKANLLATESGTKGQI